MKISRSMIFVGLKAKMIVLVRLSRHYNYIGKYEPQQGGTDTMPRSCNSQQEIL